MQPVGPPERISTAKQGRFRHLHFRGQWGRPVGDRSPEKFCWLCLNMQFSIQNQHIVTNFFLQDVQLRLSKNSVWSDGCCWDRHSAGGRVPLPFLPPFFRTFSAAMFDALSKVEIHNSTCRADICCVALLACLFTEPNIFSFSRQDGLTAAKRYRFDKQHFKRIFYSLFCVGGCIGPL